MRVTTVTTITAVLSIFFGLAAQAADTPFLVEPPDPTSKERVTLIVEQVASCPSPPVITRNGFSIRVALGDRGCMIPPILITHRLDLGLLARGTYEVTITGDGSVVSGNGSFVVLDANDSVIVRPAIGPTGGGSRVEIIADLRCPAGVPCPDPTVTFGGIAATDVLSVGWNTLLATTPPHAAGAVEVQVSRATTKTSYAFRYYDPAAAPLPALFERVLIPVIYNGAGANGSQWETEVSVRNNNSTSIDYWRGKGDVETFPALASLTQSLGESLSGRFLFVPRDVAANLHFGALVRDVSREEREWGTELPVVRENDFSPDVDLLNIPADTRFRHRLRIYSLVSLDQWMTISVYTMNDGSVVRTRQVKLTSSDPCYYYGPCPSVRPAFAQLDDLLTGLNVQGGRVGIRVVSSYGGAPIWAFVTVTNNETHHVTMISPQ